jgi:hypothetical protein
MIVRVSSFEQKHLLGFLEDCRRVPGLAKPQAKLLAALRHDLRAAQVNSQRFNYAKPFLKVLHNYALQSTARVTTYRLIPRWRRALVLPAVFTFLFYTLRVRFQMYGRLAKVQRAVEMLNARCSLVKPPQPAPAKEGA